MDTSPELTMHIGNTIYTKMPYRGSIISYDISTNNWLGNDASVNGGEDCQDSPDWFGKVAE
jgi:hypothetical protein